MDTIDEGIPASQPLAGTYVVLTFRAVTGVTSLTGYRIWREISVAFDADSTGQLVPLEPVMSWVPWGRVDAIPGTDITMRVVVAVLDDGDPSYGISAEVVTSGSASRSRIVPFPRPQAGATATSVTSWGQLKGHGR